MIIKKGIQKSSIVAICFLCCVISFAQIESVPNSQRSNVELLQQFRYTSPVIDTISIKIVNPQGALQSMPVKNRAVAINEEIHFSFNSKYLKKGQYRILVEGKENDATHVINLDRKTEHKKE